MVANTRIPYASTLQLEETNMTFEDKIESYGMTPFLSNNLQIESDTIEEYGMTAVFNGLA